MKYGQLDLVAMERSNSARLFQLTSFFIIIINFLLLSLATFRSTIRLNIPLSYFYLIVSPGKGHSVIIEGAKARQIGVLCSK